MSGGVGGYLKRWFKAWLISSARHNFWRVYGCSVPTRSRCSRVDWRDVFLRSDCSSSQHFLQTPREREIPAKINYTIKRLLKNLLHVFFTLKWQIPITRKYILFFYSVIFTIWCQRIGMWHQISAGDSLNFYLFILPAHIFSCVGGNALLASETLSRILKDILINLE